MNMSRKPAEQRWNADERFRAWVIVLVILFGGGQAYSDVSAALTQSFDHGQTVQQLQQVKDLPAAITVIVDRAVCPIIQSQATVHSNPTRTALLHEYCDPLKPKKKVSK